MKQGLIVMLLCSVIQGVFAQNLRVTGKVLESKNREYFELANVVLLTNDSVFVSGTTTDIHGDFAFEKISAGDYLIIISAIGYVTRELELPLSLLRANHSLGEILLEEDAIALADVTVSASNTSSYSDRKLIYPSDRQVQASTNGVSLLQQLMLPKLQVNPLFNEVSLPGGGELQFRVNGVKVEIKEILALQPSEVVRVEYHDNPGLRYGNAEVVLDYIVRRPETGGSFGLDLSDAFDLPAWGNNAVSAKINHKKSEFSAYYSLSHRDFDKVSRENQEHFVYPDGLVLDRIEEGESGKLKGGWQYLSATYSFQEPDKRMFNATFRFSYESWPHKDYAGSLYNVADPTDRVYMIDHTADDGSRPALDLYYQENLKNDQTLVFNLVGTYNKSNIHRFYQEGRGGALLTDVNNHVAGNKYSIIGEGIYEKKRGANRISAGLRHTQSVTDNEYLNGYHYKTEMDQALTYVYGEFRGKWTKLDYSLGLGMTRSWYKQKGEAEDYEDYTFNPRLSLHYNLPGRSFIRLNANINNNNPSLSNLSAVEQMIDSLQIQRGNPNLKPYNSYNVALTYEVQKGLYYGNIWGYYEYQPKAIMDEKFWEGDKIVQTWNNQKDWQRLSGRATVRIGPIRNMLQFSATGGVNHYMSNGNTYAHRYTNWYANMQLSATYKKCMLAMALETNWNWFYGETLSGGENIHYIMLQYSHKHLAVGVGAFNPFINNYKVEAENRSQYASYRRTNYIGESSRMFALKLTYNFSFGRKFNPGQKKVDNQDTESGVMNTGK
ncbi:outer membrane beta-barrel protein [Parabacteroides sp. PF5-6]|uniref:outer membrane beta-barrel protein n=1 Tax=Parabacteroides sp. PF5-6 TaxID=1742403 RepID=UPI002404E886|nr:outer membrane beta-barrel protein [Parabacteroides sp. PF5-6]MDF9830049.1 hypothetical protein [Parabacteroides sp. PF5-6]